MPKLKIEIQRPELEALLMDWMRRGGFCSIEDALMHALKSLPTPSGQSFTSTNELPNLTGSALVIAMQASPYKEISLEPERNRLPVRDIAI